jgi:hypothetical protein
MGDFSTRDSHLIRDNVTVNVHRGSDVRVPHELLLHRNGSAHCIKPTSVEQRARVVMAPLQAKILALVMLQNSMGYEQRFGEIKVPEGAANLQTAHGVMDPGAVSAENPTK